MRKIIFTFFFFLSAFFIQAQASRSDILQELENNQPTYQDITQTATLKSSSRLFGDKNDLTTVIMIIPSGSKVSVIDSDSTYLHVTFEESEGYIFKRHAIIDKMPTKPTPLVQQTQPTVKEQPEQEQQISRFSYLESKYGTSMAARLMAGKIWKGMNAEMVRDSWGRAEKINRVISGNTIKEEWIFQNTWLYFENNTLLEWGPIRK